MYSNTEMMGRYTLVHNGVKSIMQGLCNGEIATPDTNTIETFMTKEQLVSRVAELGYVLDEEFA